MERLWKLARAGAEWPLKHLRAEIVAIERLIDETKALVETENSAPLLRQRNEEWRLGLVPVSEAQKVHISEDPVRRLVARSNRELFGEPTSPITFRVSLAQ